MRYSYSSISTFGNCPYKWQLRYVGKLKTIPATNADNALYLGLALHKGIETGSVEEGLNEYKSHYNVLTDANINWMMQLEYQIPKVIDILPQGGDHELGFKTENHIGYIDYVCGDTLYDFKFSNNIESYRNSPQLSIYKHFYEQEYGKKINHLVYVFVPKMMIRQKKKESLEMFRNRLTDCLKDSIIELVEVEFQPDAVQEFLECSTILDSVTEFPKNPTKLCNWCDYQAYCESEGEINWMIEKEE